MIICVLLFALFLACSWQDDIVTDESVRAIFDRFWFHRWRRTHRIVGNTLTLAQADETIDKLHTDRDSKLRFDEFLAWRKAFDAHAHARGRAVATLSWLSYYRMAA